jgi:hypothetical protein
MKAYVFVVLAALACERADAQSADPLAPVRCFLIATDRGLSTLNAMELCAGALTPVPGQCFAAGLDYFPRLSSQKVAELCFGATNLAPLECYRKLDYGNEMSEDQGIDFCATHCALTAPPPQLSNADCYSIASDQANLPYETVQNLCAGSRSAAPALCLLSGRRLNVADQMLVQLCAETRSCQSYNPQH